MQTARFDYVLPPELIAQQPLGERDSARMLCASPTTLSHRQVRELPQLLRAGDLLILNHSRVFPARLQGRKGTGGAVEVLLVHQQHDAVDTAGGGETWTAMVRGKVALGTVISLDGEDCTVIALHADGTRSLRFAPGCSVLALAERVGTVPLPPYITRPAEPSDTTRYQTVYADVLGSVAAPTAGLHLTQQVLQQLAARGIASARVELAIGPGTFKPVECETVEDFVIHAERCYCPQETVHQIEACHRAGGRVIAIGTTALRTVETAARQAGGLGPYRGWTQLFLYPPQRLQVVDGLLTNFHMPRSSLLMAVSCLTGVDRLHALYQEALHSRYRFLSYGDCMLYLPDDAVDG